MIALLLAAAVTGQAAEPLKISPQPIIGVAPTVMRTRACGGLWAANPVRQTAPKPELHKLIDLPPANLEIAVLRLDKDGCQVPVIVRYDVQGDGRAPPPQAP